MQSQIDSKFVCRDGNREEIRGKDGCEVRDTEGKKVAEERIKGLYLQK